MTKMIPVRFSLAPRVVFDLRDWYQSTFYASQIPDPAPDSGETHNSIVRARGEAMFLVQPAVLPDPNWPFGETMELVTQQSTSGIHGFHGRVRTLGGTLLNRTSCQILTRAKCRLTVLVRGFQLSTVENFEVPGMNDRTSIERIDLIPAVDYSFPDGPRRPALVEGAIRRVDGSGLAGTTVTPMDPRPVDADIPLRPVTTASDGRYLIVLDPLSVDRNGLTSFSSIDIRIAHSLGGAVVHTLKFAPAAEPNEEQFILPKRATIPTTVMTGRVVRAGRPDAGARLSLQSDDQPLMTGSVQTDVNGNWQFYGDARLPIEADADVNITVTSHGQSIDKVVRVRFGKRNDLEVFSFPVA